MPSNRKSRYFQLVKDVGIFGIGTLGSKLVLFFLVPLYTNVLSQEEYGIAELVITVSQLVMPFISLGIYEGMFRFGLEDANKKSDAYLNATIAFVFGSIITVAITPLFSFYKGISDWKWYMCAYVIVSLASATNLNYLKIKDKNKLYSALNILQALLLVSCNVLLLVVIKAGIKGYLISTIASTGMVALLAFVVGKMHYDLSIAYYDKGYMKKMIIYSVPLIINSVSWWVIHSSDKIMIEWMLNAAVLGLYTAAAKIPSLLNVVITIFNQAWRISSIKEYDESNNTTFYSRVFKYYYIVIFGACVFLNSLIRLFMKYYVGIEFFEAWRFVPILLLSAAFSAFSAFAGTLFEALKDSKSIMTTTLVSGVINIIVNLLMIPIVGAYGAAIGTLIAYIVISYLRMSGVKKKIDIDYSIKKFFVVVIIASIQTVFITLNMSSNIVSCICIIIFAIVCKNDIIELIYNSKRFK